MDPTVLVNGYKKIVSSIYSPENYYERIKTFLKYYKPCEPEPFNLKNINALIKSVCILGIFQKNRKYYWEILFTCLYKYPKSLSEVITMAIFFEHFSLIFA